ncbi:MAG: tRNA pseudouridine38-40 synthase, partial [Salibacteraceae bacterium]
SGVHASEYFAHFETNQLLDLEALKFKLNCMLSSEIAIADIFKVSDDLHARFSATARTYNYFINQEKEAFNYRQSWFMHSPLSLTDMNEACTYLLGKQDFTSFSKLHTQTRTNNCTISEASWTRQGANLVFVITADRFLHNMVRAIVGTCIEVGKGKIMPLEMKTIIEQKSRQKAGASVPGHGLFLAKINYPILNILLVFFLSL